MVTSATLSQQKLFRSAYSLIRLGSWA